MNNMEEMENTQNKFLPLGSVVLLNGGTKKVMITGFCVKTPENQDKVYDYCGCIYPEGIIRSDMTCVFEHSQINEVFFTGFINEEYQKFENRLLQIVNDEDRVEPKEENLKVEELELERL